MVTLSYAEMQRSKEGQKRRVDRIARTPQLGESEEFVLASLVDSVYIFLFIDSVSKKWDYVIRDDSHCHGNGILNLGKEEKRLC